MFTTSDGKNDITIALVVRIGESSHPNLRIVYMVGGDRVVITRGDAELLKGCVDEHRYASYPKSSVI